MTAQLHKIDPTSITSLKVAHASTVTLEWRAPQVYDECWQADVRGADPRGAHIHTGQIRVTPQQRARDRFTACYYGRDEDPEYQFTTTTDLTVAILWATYGPEGPAVDALRHAAAAERWLAAARTEEPIWTEEAIRELVAVPSGSDLIQMDDDAWAAHLAALHALNATRILPYPDADQPDTDHPYDAECAAEDAAFAARQQQERARAFDAALGAGAHSALIAAVDHFAAKLTS